MQDRISLERDRLRLLKRSAEANALSPSQGQATFNNKIEALKILMQALLKEMEALGKASALESGFEINLDDEVRRYEADLIRCALIRTGGRQRRAARLLNMKVTTLNAKIKRYNLQTDELINSASSLRQQRG
jgi:DNA-binding NtrC family response regulator